MPKTYSATLKHDNGIDYLAPHTVANNIKMEDGRTAEVVINENKINIDLKADKPINNEFTGDIFQITGDSYKTYFIKYLSNVTNAPANNINDWCILEYIPFGNTKKFKITPFTSTYNGVTQETVVSLDGLTVYTPWNFTPTSQDLEEKANRIYYNLDANSIYKIGKLKNSINHICLFINGITDYDYSAFGILTINTTPNGGFTTNRGEYGSFDFITRKAGTLTSRIDFKVNDSLEIFLVTKTYNTRVEILIASDNNKCILDTFEKVSSINGNIVKSTQSINNELATTDNIDISSCLLNGWVNSSSGFPLILTISGKEATINGYIKNGTVAKNTTLFTLPSGILPSQSVFVPAHQHVNPVVTRVIRINNNLPDIKIDNNFDWVVGEYLLNFSFSIQ